MIRKCFQAIFILLMIAGNCIAGDAKLYTALKQIHGEAIIEAGLSGKNIKIGLVDAGFDCIDEWQILSKLNENGQIKDMVNFVPDSIATIDDGVHGTWVLSYIGGYSDDYFGEEYYEGLASDAEFYLARNEYGKKDYRIEEIYLEQALEYFYQKGIRLVNISSGYTDKFKNKDERYEPEDMDGATAYISKVCAKYAALGMIIVNTVGNEGDWHDFWKRYINAPADVENVISVGATHFSLFKPEINGKYLLKARYSGTGPDFLPYVKPDLACFSDRGCSFSTPIITGLIACMLEKDSTLTIHQIKSILHRASTLYPYPNNYIGYGVPDARKVLQILENPDAELSKASKIAVNGNSYLIETDSENIVLFYKENATQVMKHKLVKSRDGIFKVKRKRSRRTTVIIDNEKVIEIIWEKASGN